MKDCKDCEFFNGYDYSDGTPYCDYETTEGNGYAHCPFNDSTNVKKKGINIEIDSGFMHEYILHTLKNAIENEAYSVASQEIKHLVTDPVKDKVLSEMDRQIKIVIESEIKNFMSNEITIGGGWSETQRTLTRTEYLSEIIEKELGDKFKSDGLKRSISSTVEASISNYVTKLKDGINAGIKTYFNEATRQALTENIVSMLMCNDTYKKLSDSMQTFLPSGNQESRQWLI